MFGIGTTELILIVLVILLLFGASRLPAALGGLGKGIKEFKKAVRGDDETPAGGAEQPQVADQLRAGLGKHVRILPDGTIEIGVPEGATLVEVDQGWATLQDASSTTKVPLVSVKRIVFKA